MSNSLASRARGITLRLTLADGTVYERTVRRMPRHWKSWLMQQLPYGTDLVGCTWSRTVAS